MTHLTLRLIVVGVAIPALAASQVPPTPPAAPAPRAKPAPLVSPALEDLRFGAMDLKFHMDEFRFETERMKFADMADLKWQADEFRLKADEFRIKADEIRLDTEKFRELAKADFARDLKFDHDFDFKFNFAPGFQDKFLDARPRAPWAQEDPADSLYRTAREALNRGEYRRASQIFNEVSKKFPKSQYAQDSMYWEAFSRYRLGSTDDLRQALKILEGINVEAMMRVGRETSVDIPALRARVQGALAARGDEEAAKQLRAEASQSSGCDREEISVRAEALSALGQMDIAAAMPTVKKVLARRDECTTELRRRALYLVGRAGTQDAVPVMLDVAKNDTDPNIRGEAMSWLGRVAGDQAVPLLEDLLKTSTDERTQRSAVSALASIDTDRARRAVRTIIERGDAAERVRIDAIMSLAREREGRQQSPEDQAYLRSLYAKMESPKLKEAVLSSVSRLESKENEQFLLGVFRNLNETVALRTSAIQRLGRMTTVNLDEMAKLYDIADSRSLREQILYALFQRKESEAVDKMLDIAKKDTDPQIRRTAINLLTRRNDERAKKWLQEIVERDR